MAFVIPSTINHSCTHHSYFTDCDRFRPNRRKPSTNNYNRADGRAGFITTKTRKGKTILKPRVPIKLSNNIGKSEACFTRLAIIENIQVSFKN
jgi:hypothetical protein